VPICLAGSGPAATALIDPRLYQAALDQSKAKKA